MHSPAIDSSGYSSMGGDVLTGVAGQYAQQLALGLHTDNHSTRSDSRSTDGSDSSTPNPEEQPINGNRAQTTPQTPAAHPNGNANQPQPPQQQAPIAPLGMALQHATGLEAPVSNFPGFNNPDLFNFQNPSILQYPSMFSGIGNRMPKTNGPLDIYYRSGVPFLESKNLWRPNSTLNAK
ncbi:unnamed protein product, partial [Mesorhabditis spiculigera]